MITIDPKLFPTVEKLDQLLEEYEVESQVESRGATAVYHGIQKSLNRPVDIKVLPNNPQVSGMLRRRFEREAHAMAQLSHPHIINVYDHGEIPGYCQYIVFERQSGPSLRQQLSDPLEPMQALAILADVSEALSYTHEKGIVHRNINPDHIVMAVDGRAKLKDFSLAKMDGGETVMSRVGNLDDTVNRANQSPEYHRGDATDHRSDVYSLGVLLYEMLTGRVPDKTFSPPSQEVPVSGRVDRVVLRCMHPDPRKRFDSVESLLHGIHQLQKHPERLIADRAPFYARLVPKTLWLLLIAFVATLLIYFLK